MIEQLFATVVSGMGWSSASWVGIVISVLAILSLIASQLDAMWPDDKQPAWVSIIVKFFARNTGNAANDPDAQQ